MRTSKPKRCCASNGKCNNPSIITIILNITDDKPLKFPFCVVHMATASNMCLDIKKSVFNDLKIVK